MPPGEDYLSALPIELRTMIVECRLQSCVTRSDHLDQILRLGLISVEFQHLMSEWRTEYLEQHLITHYENFKFEFSTLESRRRLEWVSSHSEFKHRVEQLTISTESLVRYRDKRGPDDNGEEDVFLNDEALEIMNSIVVDNFFERVLPLLPNLTALVIDQPRDADNLENSQSRCYKRKCEILIDSIASSAQKWPLQELNILGIDGSSTGHYAKPIVARNGLQIMTALRKSKLTEFAISARVHQAAPRSDGNSMALALNGMQLLSDLDLLLRCGQSRASDLCGFAFSESLSKELRLKNISHLQLTEACFKGSSLSFLLQNMQGTLTTLSLKLITFENFSAYHDVLSVFPSLKKMGSFKLAWLNAYQGDIKTKIQLGGQEINFEEYDWDNNSGRTIADSVSGLRDSSLKGPSFDPSPYYIWPEIF